jgi:hypothetical protein
VAALAVVVMANLIMLAHQEFLVRVTLAAQALGLPIIEALVEAVVLEQLG